MNSTAGIEVSLIFRGDSIFLLNTQMVQNGPFDLTSLNADNGNILVSSSHVIAITFGSYESFRW